MTSEKPPERPGDEELRAHPAEEVTLVMTRRKAAQLCDLLADAAMFMNAHRNYCDLDARAHLAVIYMTCCHLHHEFGRLARE